MAESTVILLPIFHLGWQRAWEGVTDFSNAYIEAPERLSEAVNIKRLISFPHCPSDIEKWHHAQCPQAAA